MAVTLVPRRRTDPLGVIDEPSSSGFGLSASRYQIPAVGVRESPGPRPRGYGNAVEFPELLVADAAKWRTWLRSNRSTSQGVWLVLAKKGTTHPTTLSYDEALDEAICFGWIDGQLGRRDSETFRRRFTPRNARSSWSQRNVAIAERMISAGRMHQSGQDEVQRAKTDGRWSAAYAGQANIEVPGRPGDRLGRQSPCPGDLSYAHEREPLCHPLSDRKHKKDGDTTPDASSSLSRCWLGVRQSIPKDVSMLRISHNTFHKSQAGTSGRVDNYIRDLHVTHNLLVANEARDLDELFWACRARPAASARRGRTFLR